ncbi:MAG: TetR/AcrR family transcriptional regulator [Solirubrobacteraceae bacterium]|nr:MAG: TetR/AcrR family transcriptional regulator [Solirubrobacterales bacterium]
MPRPSQEHKILDAALHCFAQRGYDGTRVKDIAECAGVTGGAIYRHYPSKEALARELYGRFMRTYSDALQQAASGNGPIGERLRRCLSAALTLYRANPAAMTFVLLRQHTFMPALPADFVYPVGVLERLIVEGQQSGTVRQGDPKLLAAIFAGCLLRPLIVSQLVAKGSFDPLRDERHDETIMQAAWSAVAAPT